jgi:hypothetical protein
VMTMTMTMTTMMVMVMTARSPSSSDGVHVSSACDHKKRGQRVCRSDISLLR